MRGKSEDGAPLQPTPLHLAPIDVDVDGLRDFRTFLLRELDTNLRPAAHGIVNDHSMGVHFGAANQGINVRLARDRYDRSLKASTANLAEYISVAELLATVIHEVSTRYTDADLSSSASVGKLNDVLAAAFNAAASQPTVEQLEQAQETQRELNRMRTGTDL